MPGRVLVVDDDANVRAVVCEMLAVAGYTVEAAENGREALARIQGARYDCLLVDLCMPEMDGLALYRAVKQIMPKLARRIVFCTGGATDEHLIWFAQGTGNQLLHKPFLTDQLVKACRAACD